MLDQSSPRWCTTNIFHTLVRGIENSCRNQYAVVFLHWTLAVCGVFGSHDGSLDSLLEETPELHGLGGRIVHSPLACSLSHSLRSHALGWTPILLHHRGARSRLRQQLLRLWGWVQLLRSRRGQVPGTSDGATSLKPLDAESIKIHRSRSSAFFSREGTRGDKRTRGEPTV